jgi:cyclase
LFAGKIKVKKMVKITVKFLLIGLFTLSLSCEVLYAQTTEADALIIRSTLAGGVVYMLDCENGFSGGNVAASIGPDGILLVDDMFKANTPKVLDALKEISDKNVRIVVNSHFHSDHIQGNSVLSGSATIVAHENLIKRLKAEGSWAKQGDYPHITYSEKLTIHFNGEEIQVFHLPNGHTDGDTFVYFTGSKVIHLGDTFFNGMFPAVYKSGGGDLLQLISNMEQILKDTPSDVKFIPGHGNLATKEEFADYVDMLKKSTSLVGAAIEKGESLDQLKKDNILAKYSSLGEGGAQTTEEYLTMLYKLLSEQTASQNK